MNQGNSVFPEPYNPRYLSGGGFLVCVILLRDLLLCDLLLCDLLLPVLLLRIL